MSAARQGARFLLLLLFFLPSLANNARSLWAEETAVLIFNHQGGRVFKDRDLQEIVTGIIQTAFSAVDMGIAAIVTTTGSSLNSAELVAACGDAGVIWAVIAATRYENDTLFWQFAVYDSKARTFRAYDFSSAHTLAGISALGALSSSVGTVARHWYSALTPKTFDGKPAVSGPQKFILKNEEARVRYGSGNTTGSGENVIEAGTVEGGSLTAAFVPFPAGLPVFGEIVKEHYYPANFSLPKGVTETPKKLPALQKKTRHSVSFNYFLRNNGSSGFPGIDAEYRFHILPDRLFLQADWAVWTGPIDLPGPDEDAVLEDSMFRQEYRFAAALYLQPRNAARFRVTAGSALSYEKPWNSWGMFLVEPVWGGLEYHLSHVGFKAEVRWPLSVGGMIDRVDFRDLPVLGLSFFAGVMLKW
ncbi:hypothetical protein AGMMS4952_04030 [Spirochaetia bacterium]|nr:hypothetical protein AGMMS4952_04030 [Spirochaetia bacterium]